MRLFIATDISQEAEKALKEAQSRIKGRATLTKSFHLTLKFLGEIDEKKVPEIIKRMEAVKGEGFEAELGGMGAFPNERMIRVIWTGLEPKEKMIQLQGEVEKALEGIGEKDDKKFHPHITLARVKEQDPDTAKALKIEVPKIKFRIESIKLYKSTLTPQGPEYECLKEHRLG